MCGAIVGSGIGGLNEIEEQQTPADPRKGPGPRSGVHHSEADGQRGERSHVDSITA